MMSLENRTTDELLKERMKNKWGTRGFLLLFILTLLLYQLDKITQSTWLVLSIVYILITAVNAYSLIRINNELKRRET
jgi:hypothetical protein